MRRILGFVTRALARTADLWPDIERAYRWLRAAAHILENRAGHAAAEVEARYARLIAAWTARRGSAGTLTQALDHFVKVTASYWPGLFPCYGVAGLARTNNDLEQLFGAHRFHERRATGRKTASPTLVLRGAVRLIAGTATRLARFTTRDLAKADRLRWRSLRHQLEQRRQARVLRCRFRKNPDTYLHQLERLALQRALPS